MEEEKKLSFSNLLVHTGLKLGDGSESKKTLEIFQTKNEIQGLRQNGCDYFLKLISWLIRS